MVCNHYPEVCCLNGMPISVIGEIHAVVEGGFNVLLLKNASINPERTECNAQLWDR